ncbi:hypothetical protein C8J57DRAFT_1458654 [Mycena rebaudengoi]|nr:hypothetical protein C8J57DRAFT_1458654 [Mycena rebaudengoi]
MVTMGKRTEIVGWERAGVMWHARERQRREGMGCRRRTRMDGWMGVEILRHEPEACWKCPLVHTHVALASIAAKGDPHKHTRSKLGGVLRGDGAASASTGQPPGCASEAIICQICWFVVPWATARTVASRANRDVEPEKPKGELVQMRIESKLWKIVVATCLQTPLIPVIYGPASAQNIFRLDRLFLEVTQIRKILVKAQSDATFAARKGLAAEDVITGREPRVIRVFGGHICIFVVWSLGHRVGFRILGSTYRNSDRNST